MRVVIPQIAWHARDPVLTIDFDPKSKSDEGFYRLASGGADRLLLIWRLTNPTYFKPDIICVAELNRHQKGINVVRFSPCGNYIASGDDDSYVYLWKKESVAEKEEVWNIDKIFRRHVEDVSDLCWSPDGNYIVSGSVDNTAVLWDVKKGTPIHFWSEREHTGFVQGVVYDPLGEFSATMCIDRNLRFFNNKNGKLMSKTLKYPPAWTGEDDEAKENNPDALPLSQPESETPKAEKDDSQPSVKDTTSPARMDKENVPVTDEHNEMEVDLPPEIPVDKAPPVENVVQDQSVEPSEDKDNRDKPLSEINGEEQLPYKLPPKRPATTLNRLFHDDSLKTFCRRLSFSPRGELLIVPGGLLPPVEKEEKKEGGESLSRQSTPPPVEGEDSSQNKDVVPEKVEGVVESKEEPVEKNGDEPNKTQANTENGEGSQEESEKNEEAVAAEGASAGTDPTEEKNEDEAKEKAATGRYDPETNNAVIIFCRNSWSNPCAVIPTGKSYSIAARFNPLHFQRERKPYEYDSEFQNSNKRNERIISCVGRLQPPQEESPVLLDMPYRLVYAVATNESILICDTANIEPLACVKNIHCTRMTDIAWSPDGLVLIASSTDGFCSILTFEKEELGAEFKLANDQEFPALTPTCFPIAPPEPKPAKKPKEPKEPKEPPQLKEKPEKEKKEKKDKPEKEKKEKKEKKDKQPGTPVENKEEKKKKPSTLQKMFNSMKNSPSTSLKSPSTPLAADRVKLLETMTPSSPPTSTTSASGTTGEGTPNSETTNNATPKRTFLDGWIQKTPKSAEGKPARRVQLTTLSTANQPDPGKSDLSSKVQQNTNGCNETNHAHAAFTESPKSVPAKQGRRVDFKTLGQDNEPVTKRRAVEDSNVADKPVPEPCAREVTSQKSMPSVVANGDCAKANKKDTLVVATNQPQQPAKIVPTTSEQKKAPRRIVPKMLSSSLHTDKTATNLESESAQCIDQQKNPVEMVIAKLSSEAREKEESTTAVESSCAKGKTNGKEVLTNGHTIVNCGEKELAKPSVSSDVVQ